MRALIVILILVAAAGYVAWRQPQVQELFQSSEREREDPLAILHQEDEELARARARRQKEEAEEKRRLTASSAPRRTAARSRSAAAPSKVPAPPSVPNAEVSRVLRQVFAAKKIGQELQIAVSNTLVELTGTVRSEEELREILRLIDKARESRRVDASAVTIRP